MLKRNPLPESDKGIDMSAPQKALVMGASEWVLLLVLSVLWGGSFFFFKVLVSELPPFTVVLGRVEKDGEVGRPIREFGSGRMGVASDGKPSLTRYAVKEAGKDWSFRLIASISAALV